MELFLSIFTGFSVGAHSFLCLTLLRRYTAAQRFPRFVIFLVAILNALLCPIFFRLSEINTATSYVVALFVLFVEGLFLFKDRIIGIFGLSLGTALHFYVFRSVVLGINAMYSNVSMYEIISTPELLHINLLGAFITHVIILIIFLAVVPQASVKIIIKNNMLLYYISGLMALLCVFLIFNTAVFNLDILENGLDIQQIMLPILLLVVFYVILLFMLKIVNLNAFQEIIEELENKVGKNEMLSSTLFNFADIVFEVNMTNDKVSRIIVGGTEIPTTNFPPYTEFLKGRVLNILHNEDKGLIDNISAKKVVEQFCNSVSEINYDYRSFQLVLTDDKSRMTSDRSQYLWYKIRINSKLDKKTNEITAVCTIDEINTEKEAELALHVKSERDSLTGAYNKVTFHNKVAEYLKERKHGTLFVFDIDYFKNINDNLGHAYGDQVLCEIYNELVHLFRSDDLIGRFGGDEYVAFIKGDYPKQALENIAQRICSTIESTFFTDEGTEIKISTSIGIASAPNDGVTYEKLFEAADSALYISKNKGKNTYTFYENRSIKQ